MQQEALHMMQTTEVKYNSLEARQTAFVWGSRAHMLNKERWFSPGLIREKRRSHLSCGTGRQTGSPCRARLRKAISQRSGKAEPMSRVRMVFPGQAVAQLPSPSSIHSCAQCNFTLYFRLLFLPPSLPTAQGAAHSLGTAREKQEK